MTSNDYVSQAVAELKAANDLVDRARSNLVLAGLGEDSIRFQKRLADISSQIIVTKRKAAKTVGAIKPITVSIS